MNYQDAVQQYKETAIKTADGGTLIILLYEEIDKHLEEATHLLNTEKHHAYDKVNYHITQAQRIIIELATALEKPKDDIEFYDNLLGLYLFFNKELSEANVQKNHSKIIPIQKMIRDLLESWKKISNTSTTASYQKRSGINLSG